MLRSTRGVLLGLFLFFGFCFMVVSTVSAAFQMPRTDPETVRSIAPLAILLVGVSSLLTSNSEKAVTFTMPEVEFLFPGPFTRRELLLYKLAGSAAAASLTAIILATVFLRLATWWIAGWIGIWLSLVFIQLLSMTIALVVLAIGERAYSRSRKIVLAAIGVLLGFGVWQVWPTGEGWSLIDLAADFRASTGGRVVLAPFEVFGRAIAAETLVPGLVLWGGAALGVNLVLTAVVLLLDANFLEAASVASQKRYEAILRARRGQLPTLGERHTSRWRLPELPWFGGAGPLAWRQSIQLIRTSPRALVTLVAISVFAVPGFVTVREDTADLTTTIIGIVAWGSFFVISTMPSGFRGDLDYMDWFKMLPLRPRAIVAGELLSPILFITALQAVILAGSVAFGLATQHAVVAAAVGFALPANLLLVTTDNLLFLWYPSRQVASSPGDMQFVGRQILMMLGRVLLIFLACGVAGAVVGLAALAGIRNWSVLAAIGWLMLMAGGLTLTWATTSAFHRFDPSLDMPG